MIRASPELLSISRRWFEILRTKLNTDELSSFLSSARELRFIRTGDDEFWSGLAARKGVSKLFAEIPAPTVFEELEAEAFENGETGWSSFLHRITAMAFNYVNSFREVIV